ncbi:hypothetical protein [Acidithiobacillus sulfuriphilus]|uniref:hypothetical protein n=1 Tax=Acidithiobacillus sulfuriphilus TaxID=1867749 RepID=UPI003F5DF3E0
MISHVLKTSLISLGVGFLTEIVNGWLSSQFLSKFFEANLITILVALLAINAATMGIVLTKIRDLIDRNGGSEFFRKTRAQMLLSVKEQVGLIVLATSLLAVKSGTAVANVPNMPLLVNSVVTGIFVYALIVLYDTAKSVLIIVDYEG